MFRSASFALAFALAFNVGVAPGLACASGSTGEVLVSSHEIALTRSDYDEALTRIPEDKRAAFAASASRLTAFVNSLLVTKTLAERARRAGLPPEPGMPQTTPVDIERALAAAQLRVIDAEAAREFDARQQGFAAAARENYLLNDTKYVRPEQVSVSAILISSAGRGDEAALARAKATRDKLVAWADFAVVAKEVSDDKASASQGGQLGWRSADKMDPELAKVAFALKVGEVSQPVLQSNGYALIRIDARRPAERMSFDEAKPEIMAQLKADYVARNREAIDQSIRNDPTLKVDQAALDSLVLRVDPASFRLPPVPTSGGSGPAAR